MPLVPFKSGLRMYLMELSAFGLGWNGWSEKFAASHCPATDSWKGKSGCFYWSSLWQEDIHGWLAERSLVNKPLFFVNYFREVVLFIVVAVVCWQWYSMLLSLFSLSSCCLWGCVNADPICCCQFWTLYFHFHKNVMNTPWLKIFEVYWEKKVIH